MGNDTIGCTHCGFKNVSTVQFFCMGQCGAFLCEKCLREGLEKLTQARMPPELKRIAEKKVACLENLLRTERETPATVNDLLETLKRAKSFASFVQKAIDDPEGHSLTADTALGSIQDLELVLARWELGKDLLQELASLLEFVADAYYHLSNPRSHDFCDGCGRASSLGPPYHNPDCPALRVQELLARVKAGANATCADHDFLTGIDNIVCGLIEGASREETAEALLRFVLESKVGTALSD